MEATVYLYHLQKERYVVEEWNAPFPLLIYQNTLPFRWS